MSDPLRWIEADWAVVVRPGTSTSRDDTDTEEEWVAGNFEKLWDRGIE